MNNVRIPGFTAGASLGPAIGNHHASSAARAADQAITPQMEMPDPSDTRDQPPIRFHPPPPDDSRPPWWRPPGLDDNRPPWATGGDGGSGGGGDVAGDWPAYRRCLAGCMLMMRARELGCEEIYRDSVWDELWCNQDSGSMYRECVDQCRKDYDG